MTSIELSDVTVSRGDTHLLRDLDLAITSGERLAVLGPSGCGKTTLLRTIAGVEAVTSGAVLFDGLEATELLPRDRNVALVDQRASLQPHLNVERNLAFPLRLRRVPRPQIRERVAAETRAFSLRDLLRRKPATLSGGERHEVAIARSLVRRASVLLMDEPFSRIDPVRRGLLLRELIQMQEGFGVTLVIATNDQRIAMGVAERIAVLDEGRLVQLGTGEQLYQDPATIFVAGFVGTPPMNLLDGVITRSRGRVEVQAGPFAIPTWAADLTRRVGYPIVLGVRPQRILIDEHPTGRAPRLRVVRREFLGAEVIVHLAARGGGPPLTAVAAHPGPSPDANVTVTAAPADIHLFDPVSGARICKGV